MKTDLPTMITATAPSPPSCATCRFSAGDTDSRFECRRHPPVIVGKEVRPRYYGCANFPLVVSVMWCGEYEAKP